MLILDEPTSSLDHGEVEQLFRVIRELRDSGVAVLFALDLSAAQSSFDDPSLDCARRPDRCRALRDRGETAATARTILAVAGVAALAVGGVLLVLDLRAPAGDREPALALQVGAGTLDAVMTW